MPGFTSTGCLQQPCHQQPDAAERDVCQFTVFVTDQRDERGAVRIVFQTFDSADDVKLATLEIDETVRTLVTTALKANSDTTGVVTATLLGQTFGQGT